jgi:hypothetical protein
MSRAKFKGKPHNECMETQFIFFWGGGGGSTLPPPLKKKIPQGTLYVLAMAGRDQISLCGSTKP